MKDFVLKGNICFSETAEQLRVLPGACLVCEDGRVTGVFETLPERFAPLPLTDFGERLILPGFTDLHLHAPQFAHRGMGMDLELLDWLNTYTFPQEAKYADPAYADRAYEIFTRALRRSATTRAVMFATIHSQATGLLMEKLEATGLITYVGRVNMDCNCPDYLRDRDVDAALADTEAWIQDARSRFANTKPIITPRFVPTCTARMMEGQRRLVEKYDLPVQSHLSENLGEIAWVKELFPDSDFYGQVYDHFGLFGGDHPCIMAHCVHSGPEEVALMRKNGVYVAHAPLSNTNLASGIAPVVHYLREGLHVGLASDVAGGETENLFCTVNEALRVSKLRWRLVDQSVPQMTVEQAFYLATLGGGSFFGQVGSFLPGYEFDAIVLDDSSIGTPLELDVRARLHRCLSLADDRHITAKFVRGQRLY